MVPFATGFVPSALGERGQRQGGQPRPQAALRPQNAGHGHLRSAGSRGGPWGGCGRQGGPGSRWVQGRRSSGAGLPTGQHGRVSPGGAVPSASPQDPGSAARAEVSSGVLGTCRRRPGCNPLVPALPPPPPGAAPLQSPPLAARSPLLTPPHAAGAPCLETLKMPRLGGKPASQPQHPCHRGSRARGGAGTGLAMPRCLRSVPQPAAGGVDD